MDKPAGPSQRRTDAVPHGRLWIYLFFAVAAILGPAWGFAAWAFTIGLTACDEVGRTCSLAQKAFFYGEFLVGLLGVAVMIAAALAGVVYLAGQSPFRRFQRLVSSASLIFLFWLALVATVRLTF